MLELKAIVLLSEWLHSSAQCPLNLSVQSLATTSNICHRLHAHVSCHRQEGIRSTEADVTYHVTGLNQTWGQLLMLLSLLSGPSKIAQANCNCY